MPTSTRQDARLFTKIFGESQPFHWADRAVGPYGETSMHTYPRRGGRLCPPAGYICFTEIYGEFVTSHRADRVVGPYRVSANPYYPANFERKAFLPQILKRNYLQI